MYECVRWFNEESTLKQFLAAGPPVKNRFLISIVFSATLHIARVLKNITISFPKVIIRHQNNKKVCAKLRI